MKAIIFAVLAGLCWGVGEVFTKLVLHTKEIGPVTAVAVRTTAALPLMWLVYAVTVHGMKLEPAAWTSAKPETLLRLFLGSGLLAGAGGVLFFYLALNYGEVSRVKPIAFALAPAIAVVLGWLFLNEVMTVKKVAAVGLILAGVVMLSTK